MKIVSSRPGSFKRNAFWSGITHASDWFMFILAVVSGRILGATDFGTVSFALAVSTIFATFTSLGLNQLTVRDVARDQRLASRYLGNLLCWKCLLNRGRCRAWIRLQR